MFNYGLGKERRLLVQNTIRLVQECSNKSHAGCVSRAGSFLGRPRASATWVRGEMGGIMKYKAKNVQRCYHDDTAA